jgi:hypothetical protein
MRILALILLIGLAGCRDQPSATSEDHNAVNGTIETKASEERSVGDVILSPMTVAEGRLSLLIPKDFSLMDEDMLQVKYPSERRPTHVYTNKRGSVNIAVNHTSNRMQPTDLPIAHKQFESMFRNLYPSATWFTCEMVTINDREWFALDLRTPAIDTEIRNIMAGTSVEGRLLMVSVNITKELEDTWLEPAAAIIASLHVED